MRKIVLSALAALTIGTAGASASDVTLYQDENGQVFTSMAEGRTEIKSKETPVFAKADKLKFSGKVYTGFNYKDMKGGTKADGTLVDDKNAGSFEIRRNYVQVKAYLLEDPKSYFRVTLDSVYSNSKDGYSDIFLKYAYLYINDILPSTGVEIGMVHRPWIDYEEHQGWWMRSISKVFIEAGEAGHLSNSSDLGFNFKTKTEYFTSEIGLFNGEGYHGVNDNAGTEDEPNVGDGISAEWRLTGSLLGNGKKKRNPLKESYFDASFFGQYNMKNSANTGADGSSKHYRFLGLHTVYNMPSFLISAQYVDSDNDLKNTTDWNGKGYSLNGTFRFGEKKEFSAIARYDYWDNIDSTTGVTDYKENNYIYGVAWNQNKNVKWLLSGQTYNRDKDTVNLKTKDWTSGMLTAEVHW